MKDESARKMPPRAAEVEQLLTADEVAAILKVSKRWVYDKVSAGELPSGRYGKHLRFDPADVRAYVTAGFRK